MRKFVKPLFLASIPVIIVLASYSVFQNTSSKSDQNILDENSTNNSNRGPASSDGESINDERSRSFNNGAKSKSKSSLWNSFFGGSDPDETEVELANEPASSVEKNQNTTNSKKTTITSRFPLKKSITPLTAKSGPGNYNKSSKSNNSENRIDDAALAGQDAIPNGNELRKPDFTADNKNQNPVNNIISNIFPEDGTTANNTEIASTTGSSKDQSDPIIASNNSNSEASRDPAVTNSSSTSSTTSSSSGSSGGSSASSSNSYLIGGSVTGLNGTVVLQNNSGDDLTITQNGKYTFSKYILDQKSFSVTVKTQPTVTPQICVVVNGSGTISGSSVSNVNIHCANSFTVGGTLSGLVSGSVILQNNSGNSLTLTQNGSFTFSNAISDLTTYTVTVFSEPSGQSCQLTNASDSINNSNVTNVTVVCSTSATATPTATATATATPTSFTVGGTITGLNGTVILQNNSGDNLALFTNGSFTFVTSLSSADTYSVTVLTQPANHPTTPHQVCTVTNGSGTISSANITNISINCVTTSYTVGGTVTGLSGILVLQNNGGDNKTIVSNGAFTFATSVNDLSTYSVSVLTNPSSPNQTCALASEAGTINDANITNVTITCTTNSYTIGGTVAGLSGTVVLQNNSGNNKTITTNGAFSFTTSITDGNAYSVSVLTLPSNQICSVTGNGSGTVSGANVTNVAINCATPTVTFTNIASSYLTINWSSLTAPQSTAASIEYKLYKNTGTVGAPVWTTVQNWTTALSKSLDSGIAAETIYYFKLETKDSTGNSVETTASIQSYTVGYPSSISIESSAATANEADIAINSSNKSFAVWRENDIGLDEIKVAQNSGTDRIWSTPYKLNTTSTFGSVPQIAVDALGNAIAIWISNTGTNILYASRYDSAAATPTWSSPVNITNLEADSDYDANVSSSRENSAISMDSLGNALVVWTQDVQISGSWRTHIVSNYFDKSASSGAGAWLGHEVVDLGSNTVAPYASSEPSVSFDTNGNAVAVWREYDGTNYKTQSAKFLIADKQWYYISRVDNEAGNTFTSNFVLKTNNDIFAIWAETAGNTLKGGRFTINNPGGGWTRETIGTSNFLTSNHSRTKVSVNATGNVAVAYNKNTTIAVNKYNISTDTWGTPSDFSGSISTPGFISSNSGFNGSSSYFDSSTTYLPQVTIDNSNNLMALWTESGDGSGATSMKLFSAKYSGPNSTWNTPILLEYAVLSGSAPYYNSKLVTSPSGKNLVVFQTVSNNIYVRHLDENVVGTPYTLTYDANSSTTGTVPTDSNYYTVAADVLGNTGTLTRTGYGFTGWNTAADRSGTHYSTSDDVPINGNTTLYASWAPPPTVTTTAIVNSIGGGTVSVVANCTLTAAGIVWSTSLNPTIADSITTDGTVGTFTSNLSGLAANTTYYVRAYATNCAGTAYGNQVSYTTGNYVVRGTGPAGGIVFYDKGSITDGWRYLEAAPSDQSTGVIWNKAANYFSTGATATTVGSGRSNTTTIIATQGDGTYAAKATLGDVLANGFVDWFLPSKDELLYMYTILKLNGLGSFTSTYYWTSSETTSSYSGHAYVRHMGNNTDTTLSKDSTSWRVRAIRAFAGDTSQYTITYDVNGGSGTLPTDSNTYAEGKPVTVLANSGPVTRGGYSFNGWNTLADGSGTTYTTGQSYPMGNSNSTLYATWVTVPTVTTSTTTAETFIQSAVLYANVKGTITVTGGGITTRGVCWNTTGTPTVADSKTIDGTASGTFASQLTGISVGNVYYVRAYATNEAGTTYGNEIVLYADTHSLRSAGPAGGLVFYVKTYYGEGWRFMEAAPVATESFVNPWGCDGTDVSGTIQGVGGGRTNSELIVAACGAGTAAKYCDDLVYGGYSDWYLPSINEVLSMRNELYLQAVGNYSTGLTYTSSTQYSTTQGYVRFMSDGTVNGQSKSDGNTYTRCIRGF